MQKKNRKAIDHRMWNILSVMFALIWNGTIGTTIILLPFIVFVTIKVFKVFKDFEDKEDINT